MTTKEFDIALGQLMGKRYGTLLQEDPDAAPVMTVVLEAMKTVHAWGKIFTKHAVGMHRKRKREQARAALQPAAPGA